MKHRNAAKREPAAQAREQTQGRKTRPEASDSSRSSENAAGGRDPREPVGEYQAERHARNTARRHRQSHDCGHSAADARRSLMQQARPGRGRARNGFRRSRHAQGERLGGAPGAAGTPNGNRILDSHKAVAPLLGSQAAPPIPQARLMRKEPLEMGSNTASASNRGRTSETPPLPHKAAAPLLGPQADLPSKTASTPREKEGLGATPGAAGAPGEREGLGTGSGAAGTPGEREGVGATPAQQARSTEADPETPSRSRRSLLERKSNLTHSKHARRRSSRFGGAGNGATRRLARCAPIEDGAPRTRPRLGAASEKPPYTPARQSSTSQSYLRLTKEKVSYRPVRSKAGMKLSAAAGPSCQ